jgi:hypothetical protein
MLDLVILSGFAIMGTFSFVAANNEFHHDMESKIKRDLAAPKESTRRRSSLPAAEEKIVHSQSSSPNSGESLVSVYGNGKYRVIKLSEISGYKGGAGAPNAAHLTKIENGAEKAFFSMRADCLSAERIGYPPLFISNAQYRSGKCCTTKNMPHHWYSTPPPSPSSSSGASTPSVASIPDDLEWSDPFTLDATIWSVEKCV